MLVTGPCENCGEEATKRCSRCQNAWFCDRSCQARRSFLFAQCPHRKRKGRGHVVFCLGSLCFFRERFRFLSLRKSAALFWRIHPNTRIGSSHAQLGLAKDGCLAEVCWLVCLKPLRKRQRLRRSKEPGSHLAPARRVLLRAKRDRHLVGQTERWRANVRRRSIREANKRLKQFGTSSMLTQRGSPTASFEMPCFSSFTFPHEKAWTWAAEPQVFKAELLTCCFSFCGPYLVMMSKG